MRIIINVKYRSGRIAVDTRLDSGSKDKVVEMNAGKALYDAVNGMLADIGDPKTEKAGPPAPALHCPVCGVELDEGAVSVNAAGQREWMCNVCGETGVWDAELEEDDPITATDPHPIAEPEPPPVSTAPTPASSQP